MPTPTKTKTLPKKTAKPIPRKPRQNASTPAAQQVKHAALSGVTIAAVPDRTVADRYVSRKVSLGAGRDMQDMDLFDYCFNTGSNLLVEGPTGPGKTMATRAWCALRSKVLARVNSNNGIDKSAIFGKYIPDGKGGFVWQDGAVTHVMRNGGAILINEVNFVPERVSTVLFGTLDDNREVVLDDKDGEIVRAHRQSDCWCDLDKAECKKRWVIIIADMNPDYAGTRDMNAALRNRFSVQMVWDYDAVVESKLVKSEALRALAGQIRDDDNYATPVSTNMLMEFERIAQDLSVHFAVSNFINHFASDERDAIRLVCDVQIDKIEADYLVPEPEEDDDVPADTTNDDGDDDNFDIDDMAEWVFSSDD